MLMIMKLFTMLFSHAAPHQRNVQCVVTTCLWFYCWWYCLQCWCTKSEEYPMCGNNLFVVLLLMILFTMLLHHIRGISNVWLQLLPNLPSFISYLLANENWKKYENTSKVYVLLKCDTEHIKYKHKCDFSRWLFIPPPQQEHKKCICLLPLSVSSPPHH